MQRKGGTLCLDSQERFCGRNIIRDETWNIGKMTIGDEGELATNNLSNGPNGSNWQDLFWGMIYLTNI